ncbi:hypothetical protein QC760_006547 [Botrytis cinerea]
MSPFIDIIGSNGYTKRNMVEKTSCMTPSKKEALILSHLCSILELPTAKVDLESNFVGLGGHSLMAIKLSKACKRDGLALSIPSILLSPTLTQLIDSATETRSTPSTNILKDTRDLNTLVSPTRLSHERRMSLSKPNGHTASASNLSLTEMQHSFMHSYQRQPGSNIISFYETYSSANIPTMKTAWKTVIDSEPVFRTIFDHDRVTATYSKQPLPFIWDEVFVEDTDTYISELEKEIVPEKMEVTFTVLTPRTQRSGNVGVSTIIWRVHHAFIDGYSANLLYDKVRKIVMGQSIIPGTPFSNVIHEVQKHQQMNRDVSRAFWRKQMESHPSPVGDLALPVPSSPSKLSRNADVSFTIPSEEIAEAARSAGISLASWFQAAWGLVLSMYADSDTVVFGTVLSGRNLSIAGMDDTIGPLINTLPFHVSLDRKQTTLEYVQSVFRHSVDLGTFQHSLPEDGYSRQFASALAMEFDMQPTDDHKIRPIGQSWFKVVPDIPLSIFMSTTGTIRMSYQTQKYTESDIELLSENFQSAILSLLSPAKSIGECLSNLLSSKSHETLMKMGNCLTDETSPASIKDDLVTLFERAAVENPSILAVEKAGDSLTYQEFDNMATKLSAQLSKYVQPGDIVCVHADRSINWLVAIYGILKAGAVYSAQDAALPGHIREANFQTAGGKLFLTPASSQRKIAPESCKLCLSVEDLVQLPLPSSVAVAPRQTPRPADNAYLCFTSGSTGKPKGVMCSHEGLVAFQKDLAVRLFALPGQRISQLMSPAFDGSIHEIFSALSYGATIVLADGIHPFSHLEKSTAAILTPSIANILDPEDFPMLRNVYLVGEPVPQHVNDVWSSVKNLYNMYGPTEATCGATIKRLLPGKPVNIGAPNPTTRVYILDRNQQLLPPGVIGEIYLAGVQVARGYIGMPQMSAERFLPDTICNRQGEMMYRTGDRGYFNRAGEVECLGRNDRQIKLRGFRLDLNDLEIRVAEALPECSGIAICQKGDYLVAMVQPETLDIAKVRAKVTQVLPVHAVPRVFMAVEKFPMTPAGKLDYKAITNMTLAEKESTPKKIESSTEVRVAEAWKELLGLESNVEITRDSEFVSLGGHSVMQLRLASKLSEIFHVRMTVSHIMQSANLLEMAKIIENLRAQTQPTDVDDALVPLGKYRVSPIEREWWEKYRLNVGSSSFNVTYACAVDTSVVDTDKLISAWNTEISSAFMQIEVSTGLLPYGILKAGAVYSAQDAALPGHIREANFQTAGGNSVAVAPRQTPRPADNAYLCFTSGSTGKPKGVMCSHEGLVAFQKDLAVRLFALPGQRISQLMSPAFDGSIHEIFSALSYGATIVLADGIHPFSHLEIHSCDLNAIYCQYLGPRRLPHAAKLLKNLYNMYGPTEATCGATIKRLLPGKPVNIGAPNPTTRVYILDRNQQLATGCDWRNLSCRCPSGTRIYRGDYLVAMVQPETLDIAKVRAKVTQVLPVHAVPRVFMAVEKFPMTPAGKLDYKAITNMTLAEKEPRRRLKARPKLGLLKHGKSCWDSNPMWRSLGILTLGGHSVMQLRLCEQTF